MPNLLLMTDSYKAGHSRLYPPGLTCLYSYLESRGGIFPATNFFGLQYYLERYLAGPVVTQADVDAAEAFWTAHFGRDDYFDAAAWRALVARHDGRLPLRIEAVPEGTLVPTDNVLMTVENSDPAFPWLTNWFETLLLKVWYPTTVATQSRLIRGQIAEAYRRSGADPAGVDFACHDFGYRGVSSEETAEIGAASHLLSFNGTDTVAGIRMLAAYYDGGISGFSIPATEHSIICAYGRENEDDAFRHMLETFPNGTIACVSDSYDIFNAVSVIWGDELRDAVLSRNGILVVRPDSGDPMTVVPWVLEALWERFGGSVNAAGFRVLNPHVRVIQGDAMDFSTIGPLYDRIVDLGWSAENLTVGSGGGLLQLVNRDTARFALKASEVTVNGVSYGTAKDPVTDQRKRSKEGRLKLVRTPGGGWDTLSSIEDADRFDAARNELVPVFADGEVIRRWTLAEVRERVRTEGVGGRG